LEGRGNFYDKYGALKDVVQNHLLQMLALTTMEVPEKLSGDYIRSEKAKVLRVMEPVDVLLGQFKGYKQENNVKEDSNTETFAALKLRIDNQRWKGVPIYLKAGKGLDEKKVMIHITFKKVTCLLDVCPRDSNSLTIRVQPDEGFSLGLFAKVPAEANQIEQVKMDFSHKCITKHKSTEAYKVLLNDIIKGDQSLFVRNDEIEYAWAIIDKIKAKKLKAHSYIKGSKGPKELSLFERKNKMKWVV
jgi:glucose-6-phosphate 1-dehydrogenase